MLVNVTVQVQSATIADATAYVEAILQVKPPQEITDRKVLVGNRKIIEAKEARH